MGEGGKGDLVTAFDQPNDRLEKCVLHGKILECNLPILSVMVNIALNAFRHIIL